MNTTNTKETTITTKNQAAQAQVTQPTLFRQDIKETLRSWLEPYGVFDGKFYSEISHMLCMAITSDYLNELDMQNLPEPEVAGAELLQRTADAFRTFNEVFAEVAGAAIEGLNIPDELAPCQIARLIQLFFHAVQYSRSEIYGDDYMRKWCNGDDEDIAVMVYFDEHIYYNPFETGIYGKPGDSDYLREEVRRSKAGQYYMSVKCGVRACYFNNLSYDFAGREFSFPVAPEALSQWAETNLYGNDYARACKEFGSDIKIKETVWEYRQGADETQPGFIYEYLRKTAADTYALFSTDCSYPYFGYSIAAAAPGSRKVRDDLYLYYITADTARRWAEARGMDLYTAREVFG